MILALDPGTQLGWAVMAPDGAVIAAGVCTLRTSAKDRRGLLLLRAFAEIGELVGKHLPSLIAYERVFRHSSADAKDMYGGIVGVAEMVADTWERPTAKVPVGTWKKALTGNGNAKPPDYLAAARAKWPGVAFEEDSAAACGIADAARLGLHVVAKKAKKRRKTA